MWYNIHTTRTYFGLTTPSSGGIHPDDGVVWMKHVGVIFMFAPCINSIKALFIVPTDAHNYKIIGILKQLKF